jgi:hypothetical protein
MQEVCVRDTASSSTGSRDGIFVVILHTLTRTIGSGRTLRRGGVRTKTSLAK